MQKISLPWAFLDAVDGSALVVPPVEYKANKVKRLQGYVLTPNEIGCYLSHKEAWKHCVEKNVPTLILEDDFVLSSHFEKILNALLNEVAKWSFVRLQGLNEVPFKKVLEQSEFTLVKNQGDAVGATAYLLKPSVAVRLMKYSVDIYEPVDHFLEHYQKHGLEFLAIRPYPIDVTRAKSTIADRSERAPITGFQKRIRSLARLVDRVFSSEPWFPR